MEDVDMGGSADIGGDSYRDVNLQMPAKHVRIFAMAVQCLSRIGSFVDFEVTASQLVLATLNAAKSAYCSFTFKRGEDNSPVVQLRLCYFLQKLLCACLADFFQHFQAPKNGNIVKVRFLAKVRRNSCSFFLTPSFAQWPSFPILPNFRLVNTFSGVFALWM
jgi:hypothetical protein